MSAYEFDKYHGLSPISYTKNRLWDPFLVSKRSATIEVVVLKHKHPLLFCSIFIRRILIFGAHFIICSVVEREHLNAYVLCHCLLKILFALVAKCSNICCGIISTV